MSSAKNPVTYGMQRKCSNADADASNLYADPCATWLQYKFMLILICVLKICSSGVLGK